MLIILAVLASGAIYFNRSERQNERSIAVQRLEEERGISRDPAEAVVLRTYLEKMSELLINDRIAELNTTGSEKVIARSWTVITVRQLGGDRKELHSACKYRISRYM